MSKQTIAEYATANPGDVVTATTGDRAAGDRAGAPKVLTLGALAGQDSLPSGAPLGNPQLSGYADWQEIAQPANPPANTLRLFAEDNFGLSTLQYVSPTGNEFRICQDNVTIVRNTTGGTLLKGQAVYINGAQGNRPTVALAQANSLTTLPAIGVIFTDVANNADGFVMKLGRMTGLNTAAFSEGARLYVSSTVAGALVSTAPTLAQPVGTVVTSNAGSGRIAVDIDSIASPPAAFTTTDTKLSPATPILLDDATGNEAALTLAYTVNKATSGDANGLVLDVTETLSPGNFYTEGLIVGKKGGTRVFTLNPEGYIVSADDFRVYASNTNTDYWLFSTGTCKWILGGQERIAFMDGDLRMKSTQQFGWSSGAPATANLDLQLNRGAADTLRQIRTTNAQTFEIYNTTNSDTSPTDFERGFIRWSANALGIGAEAGGTGTARDVTISAANLNYDYTTLLSFKSGGSTKGSVDNTGVFDVQGIRPNSDNLRNLGAGGRGWTYLHMGVRSTDTAPNDDTTSKKVSIQKLAAPPTSAAYVAFTNNPGTDNFYLVLEES